jgi:hypothetical protein
MWNISPMKIQAILYIYTEHVSKSGTGRGEQGRRKRRKEQ